jgi:hypothetical protein
MSDGAAVLLYIVRRDVVSDDAEALVYVGRKGVR